eukprot:RCo012416
MTTNGDIATALDIPYPELTRALSVHNPADFFGLRSSTYRVPLLETPPDINRGACASALSLQALAAEGLEWVGKEVAEVKQMARDYRPLDWLGHFIPMVRWLRTYPVREWLLADILAGLCVGFMVVPQGMSYANLASLPAVFGLYGAFVPNMVYAMFGNSRQLAVGPVAVTSLMLGSGLQSLFNGRVNSDPNNPNDPCLQDSYNRAAVQVALMAGILYTTIGILRMGFLANFLSRAVISGFMTGAAAIIALSQVKYLLGVKVARHDPVHQQLADLIDAVKVPGAFNWRELVMGGTWIAILLGLRFCATRFRRFALLRALGPILVTVLGIGIMNATGWYKAPSTTTTKTTNTTAVHIIPASLPITTMGVGRGAGLRPASLNDSCVVSAVSCLSTTLACVQGAVNKTVAAQCLTKGLNCTNVSSVCLSGVTPTPATPTSCPISTSTKKSSSSAPPIAILGPVPQSLPQFTGSWFTPLYDLGQQLALACVICLVDICESISIAKAMAHKKRYELDATQELRGLGIANVMGALFNCYTTTGSFSRSAVNFAAGAQTPLSCLVSGSLVLIVLTALTPYLTNMPQNVQGAVVITGVLGIFEFHEAYFLWNVHKFDFMVWLVAWLCTMFLGVELGIGFAVMSSVLLLLVHTVFPVVRVMGRLPGTTMYRAISQYGEARVVPGVLIVRLDSPLYFANVNHLKDRIRHFLGKYGGAAARRSSNVSVTPPQPSTPTPPQAQSKVLPWESSQVRLNSVRVQTVEGGPSSSAALPACASAPPPVRPSSSAGRAEGAGNG